jgi:AcrR family transcriptional regulator
MYSKTVVSSMQRTNRQQKREVTKALLRQSAAQAFVRQGVNASSVDGISEAAGLSRGAFYANYTSKEELLLEMMSAWLEQETTEWNRLVEDARDVESILQGFLERFERSRRDSDRGVLLMELALHAERNPEFAVHHQEFLEAHLALVAPMYAALFQRAGKKPPADPLELAAATMSFGCALGLESNRSVRLGDPTYAGEMFLLYLRGLLAIAEPADVRRRSAVTAPRKARS